MSRMILLAFVATLAAGAATAGPRSIADCETIQAADAYNGCLASFGPVAGGHGRSFVPLASRERDYSRDSRGEAGSGMAIEHRHRGRTRMVLTPRRRDD